MSGFKSEEHLQLIEGEEDLCEVISHGSNVGDVKKFQQAGNYACNGLMMHMKRAEAGDGVFLNPPLIHQENIERKLFLPNSIETKYQTCMPVPYDIPSSLTPKLLLFHPYRETCSVFDPNLYERLARIRLLETSQIQESVTSESMFEDYKRIKEYTISEIQEMATSEIELDLRGYELVGSFPGGWLLLVNFARKSLHLYEMSGKWHTLLVYPELTTKKEFIGVCDGVETILFLEMFNRVEMVNGDIMIHIFQIQGFDIVIKHQKFGTELEGKIKDGKIKHALLCKSLLYMVIRTEAITYLNSMRLDSVGGEVVPTISDLNIDGLPLEENVFTSMILSLSNTPLLVLFHPSVQFDVFVVCGKVQDELYLLKVTTSILDLGGQFYLEPNGGGCCVIDLEEPKIYLATHNGSDCVMGAIEMQPETDTDDQDDEDAESEQDHEEAVESEQDHEEAVESEQDHEEASQEEQDEDAAKDEDAEDAAQCEQDEEAEVEADEDYFTTWTCIKDCNWVKRGGCPCQPAWLMLSPMMKKMPLAPTYIA